MIDTSSGSRPLDVRFTNTSSGATSFAWDFGDGAISEERDPVHRYERPGAYTVRLEATGSAGTDEFVVVDAVRVFAPIADAGFELQVAGSPPSGEWTPFYGGGSAVGHVVREVAQGADGPMPSEGGMWCEIGAHSTSAASPPTPGPGPTPRTGAGVSVEFTFPEGRPLLRIDAQFLSAEPYASASRNDWMSIDVSDGSSTANLYRRDSFSGMEAASNLHPEVTRTPLERITADLTELFPGSDETTAFVLTAQVGNGGDGTLSSLGHVDAVRFLPAGPVVLANFVGSPTAVEEALPVAFTDLSLGSPTSFSWDFGDGTASSLRNPAHAYTDPGVYGVTLRCSSDDAAGEIQRADYVVVYAPEGSVAFTAAPNPAPIGSTMVFTNLSTGTFVEYTWDFGDGSSLVQPAGSPTAEHVYATAGTYSVRLTGRFANTTTVSHHEPDFAVVQAPPVIAAQPQDQTVVVGQAATYSVAATGTALHYEWRRNGAVIPGANDAPQYTTPPTTAQNHGDRHSVRVHNGVGSVQSLSASLNVVTLPVIVSHPQPATVGLGQTATFTVAASGWGLSYQWQRNSVTIAGAPNAPTYTTPATTTGDNGAVYRVRVSNLAGTVVSNGAALTVVSPPTVTQHPQNSAVNAGQTAVFTVVATGTGLTYEWQRNGTPIAGAPSASTYSLANVSASDHGASIRVRVSNLGGSTTSNAATLTVYSPPAITQQPADVTVNAGSTATFHVTATGNGLGYQWLRNGVAIPGAPNASSYTTAPTVDGDNGALYRVRVTNPAGTILSAQAVLSVTSTPIITDEPDDVLCTSGTSVSFTVVAGGSGLSYQWQRDTAGGSVSYAAITGATFATLTLSATSNLSGNRYRCVVTNAAGSDTSYGALLTVVTQPTITTHPTSIQVNAGSQASFSIVATGGGLTYEWQRNNVSIPGGPNSSTYAFTATGSDNGAQYRCLVQNLAGSATSTSATLTVVTVPTITSQPVSQTVVSGQAVTFGVVATSITPMSYQWMVDLPSSGSNWLPVSGSGVTGTTTATLTLSSSAVTTSLTGNRYRCDVSNSAGTTSSNAATLTVNGAPVVTSQPSPASVLAGIEITLSVAGSGTGSREWQYATSGSTTWNTIGGATGTTYAITAPTTSYSGRRYRCLVSGLSGTGSTPSNEITITVADPPAISGVTSIPVGSSTTFTSASTSLGVTRQWQRRADSSSSWSSISGANGSTYTLRNSNLTASPPITDTEPAWNGYQYRCRYTMTGLAGEAYSNTLTLDLGLTFTRLYTTFATFSTCTSCHDDAHQSSYAGLTLGSYASALSDLENEDPMDSCVSNNRRILVNDAAGSLLYKQITGTNCGTRMGAQTGTDGSGNPTYAYGYLDAYALERIRFWINDGAVD